MPNITSVLKQEITRLARRELRSDTERLRKATARHRSEIAALKRRVVELEKQLAGLGRKSDGAPAVSPPDDLQSRVRFSAKGLRALRQRLGLSGPQLGLLLNVSAQTIYNWEAGNHRPPTSQIAALAELRGIGKREAAARLASPGRSLASRGRARRANGEG